MWRSICFLTTGSDIFHLTASIRGENVTGTCIVDLWCIFLPVLTVMILFVYDAAMELALSLEKLVNEKLLNLHHVRISNPLTRLLFD